MLARGHASRYWNVVHRYITTALRHLEVTQQGRQWTANLYAQVFAIEHD